MWSDSGIAWVIIGTSMGTFMCTGCALRVRTPSGALRADIQGHADVGSVITLSVEPRYSAAPDWDDYVRTSDTSTACDGTETGSLRACIHGGDKRSVTVTGYSSCSGLSATDALGAFDWWCDDSTGTAVFYSTLKDTAGLKDLLSASGWLENSVTVSDGATTVGESPSALWWSNPILEAPDNSSGSVTTLAPAPGTIYTVSTSHGTRGYNINQDKVAFVVLDGVTLSSTINTGNCNMGTGEPDFGSQNVMICAGSQKFLWIEGELDGANQASAHDAVMFYGVKDSVIRRVSFSNMKPGGGVSFGIYLINSKYNKLSQIHGEGGTAGIAFQTSSDYNTLWQSILSNGTSYGLYLEGSAHNSISRLYIANTYDGVVLTGATSKNNTFSGLTVTNCDDVAVAATDSGASGSNTFSQILMANNFSGIFYMVTGAKDTWANAAVVNSTGGGVNGEPIHLNLTSGKFTGNLYFANNAEVCSVSGTNPGLNSTCAADQGISDATIETGAAYDASSSFVGKVTADSVNTSHVAGSASFAISLDWTHFETPERAWGIEGSLGFPNADQEGPFGSGTGHIWDWSLSSSDTVFRTIHTAFDKTSTTCSGAAVTLLTNQDATPISFLADAIELVGKDFAGNNDNGLCESGEHCLYAPNLGAYQGHGDLIQCQYAPASGVAMYGYSTNGR